MQVGAGGLPHSSSGSVSSWLRSSLAFCASAALPITLVALELVLLPLIALLVMIYMPRNRECKERRAAASRRLQHVSALICVCARERDSVCV